MILLELKISQKQPVLANFGIFWLFLGDDQEKNAGNTGLWQAQLGALPFPLIPHFDL